jgi:hypothetical protein
MLARTRKTEEGTDLSPVVLAVIYLLRHATEVEGRAQAMIVLLRKHWSRLTEREKRWFDTHWPAVTPGPGAVENPELPDPTFLQRWLLDDALFSRSAIL